MKQAPFYILEDAPAPRLEAVAPELPIMDPSPPRSPAVLALSGVAILGFGFAALMAGNFVMDQFARSAWLGWATLGVVAAGFGLVGAGIWRELRALLALRRVDHLRADLQSGDASRVAAAALAWATIAPGGPDMLPALRAVNDPDAMLRLLRAGPSQALRDGAERLGRTAAVQTVAGIAAMPSPALDVLLVGWRGVRLVRQVATLYGVRPGLMGTVSLLRRTALSATMVGATELAANAAAHAVLSHPLLVHVVGEMAGAGVAARRMTVLARAAAVACDPVPPA